MENSILTSTKKTLGLTVDYVAFDQDVLTHINAAFSTLTQMGVGTTTGFMIEDEDAVWADFGAPVEQLNLVKTYVYLQTRLFFDPPATSFHISALEHQIKECQWRLNIMREVEVAINLPPPIVPLFDDEDVPYVPPVLSPPANVAVVPFNNGVSRINVSWEKAPNIEFVLIYFKVVGDEEFGINAWGVDKLSVTMTAEVGVDYEYYLESRADGYVPAQSAHFFVTGF